MAKPSKQLGTKYNCYSCDGRFYDLNRPEPICPRCGANQAEAPPRRAPATRRDSAAAAAKRKAPKPKPKVEPEAEEVLVEEPVPVAAVDDDFNDDVDIDAEFLDDEEGTF